MITSNRAARISEIAHEYVSDFCSATKQEAYQLLAKPSGEDRSKAVVHSNAREFADFVVTKHHSKHWGTGAFPSTTLAKTLSLFQALDLVEMVTAPRAGLGGYGSWLYQVSSGIYAVVYDSAKVDKKCIEKCVDPHDVRLKLFYHELGHLLLHGETLFSSTPATASTPNKRASSALPVMEADAWFFAGAVYGLAVGERGFQAKTLGFADTSWELF